MTILSNDSYYDMTAKVLYLLVKFNVSANISNCNLFVVEENKNLTKQNIGGQYRFIAYETIYQKDSNTFYTYDIRTYGNGVADLFYTNIRNQLTANDYYVCSAIPLGSESFIKITRK